MWGKINAPSLKSSNMMLKSQNLHQSYNMTRAFQNKKKKFAPITIFDDVSALAKNYKNGQILGKNKKFI